MARVYSESERVFSTGASPDSPEAMACAEANRQMIQRWFYDCSPAMHSKVTEGTSQDPRFVANIDRNCPIPASGSEDLSVFISTVRITH